MMATVSDESQLQDADAECEPRGMVPEFAANVSGIECSMFSDNVNAELKSSGSKVRIHPRPGSDSVGSFFMATGLQSNFGSRPSNPARTKHTLSLTHIEGAPGNGPVMQCPCMKLFTTFMTLSCTWGALQRP